MSEQPLYLVHIHTSLNESSGEGMPEIVEMKIVDPGLAQRQPERSAEVPCLHRCEGLAAKDQIRRQ